MSQFDVFSRTVSMSQRNYKVQIHTDMTLLLYILVKINMAPISSHRPSVLVLLKGTSLGLNNTRHVSFFSELCTCISPEISTRAPNRMEILLLPMTVQSLGPTVPHLLLSQWRSLVGQLQTKSRCSQNHCSLQHLCLSFFAGNVSEHKANGALFCCPNVSYTYMSSVFLNDRSNQLMSQTFIHSTLLYSCSLC